MTIVYGARSVGDLVYKRELEEWAARDDVTLVTTVDPGGETPDWTGQVGFVTPVVETTAPSADERRRRPLRPADHGQVHAPRARRSSASPRTPSSPRSRTA